MIEANVHRVTCVEDALELKRWLGERRDILAVDTETTGLDTTRDRLRLVQLGDTETGWAIAAEDWRGFLRDTLNTYEGLVVGHNLKFDLHFLSKLGVRFNPSQLHDTALAASVLWPASRIGLKHLATKYIDPTAAVGELMLDKAMNENKWTWATIPLEHPAYWAYGALDTVLTARLYSLLRGQLEERGLVPTYELECAVSDVLFRMERRGIQLDLHHVNANYEALLQYARDMERWGQSTYGVQLGSNPKVVERLLFDGVVLSQRTDKGAFSLDEDVLRSLAGHPLADAVLSYRKSVKVANTYLRNFREMADLDGRLHCSIRQMGARTGRMSITDPALQTLPRDNVVVRDAFIPSEGNALLTADYSAMEMKVFAHFAQDERMVARINEGVDLHTITAQAVYGTMTPTKQQRQVAKNANFTRIYGGGARKFALTAGITEEEAQTFYRRLDEEFPAARRFMKTVEATARERLVTEGRAYVRTVAGRECEADEDSLYKLVNYIIQGSCADLLKQKLLELDYAGLGDVMVLPIHDEVLIDVPVEDVPEVTRTLEEVMPVTNLSVTLDIEVDGPLARWGDKYRASA